MLALVGYFVGACLGIPQISRGNANSFLARHRRANEDVFGETLEGNLERECLEEICNWEEAREVFETDIAGLKEWWERDKEKDKPDDPTAVIIGVVVAIVVLIIIIVVIVGKP